MALGLNDKKAIVADVNKAAKAAQSVVIADSRGVTVGAMTELRKQAREAQVDMRVVRNTLARFAFADTPYENLSEYFVGPSLIAFSMDHPGAAARLFKEFGKTEKAFEVKALGYAGEVIPAQDLDRLASLPTYDEAIAKLMATMKEASAGKLVRTLAAVRTQKEEAA